MIHRQTAKRVASDAIDNLADDIQSELEIAAADAWDEGVEAALNAVASEDHPVSLREQNKIYAQNPYHRAKR